MFYPVRINLAFYTLTPLNGLLSVPLQSAFGLVVANNILFLSSLVLGAYGTFLLTRRLLRRRRKLLGGGQPESRPSAGSTSAAPFLSTDDWIAFVAGLVYGFASSKLFYASLGQFNIASSQWIPFFALYLLCIPWSRTATQGFRAALMAGLFLIFQTWAELTYATFLVIFSVLAFIYALIQLALGSDDNALQPQPAQPQIATRTSRLWILAAQYAVVGGMFVVGLSPFLWAMAPDLLREGDFFTSGGGFSDVFSADLLGYLMPTRLHPWLGDQVAARPFPNDKGQQIYIGYAAMLLALVGVAGLVGGVSRRLRQEGWFWLCSMLFFFWLTLGPSIRWNGRPLGVPGPFALVSQLPFFSGNRYPSRYSVMLLLCAAVLVAYGLAWLFERMRNHGRLQSIPQRRLVSGSIILVTLFFFAEHLSIPLPLNDFRIPPIYQRLADLPERGTLLELPTGWRNGARVLGRSDVLIMMQQWYQSEHGERRLGGNTSRNPDYKFQYFSDAPLIGDLIGLMNADRDHIAQEVAREWDAIIERNRSVAPAVLDFLSVNHLMVHVDQTPEPLLRFIDEVLPVSLVDEWQGSDWQGRPSTIRLYTVHANVDAAGEIDLAGELGRLYLAEGWSSFPVNERIRYATRREADLMLDLPTEGGSLGLRLFGPAAAADLFINGTFVATAPILDDDWATVAIPPGVAGQQIDRLTIRFDGEGVSSAQIVKPASSAGWPIGDSGFFLDSDAAIVVHSAGEEVGNFAHIYLNGLDVAQDQRGYNLAAVSPDGMLLESAVFDTFLSIDEAERMAAWIRQWPSGTIIAGAVRDEASTNLTASAVEELQRIGVATDLRSQFRKSHAFVGVAGASPGTAQEDRSLLRSSDAAVGSPVDAETVFGGIAEIRLPTESEK